MLEIGTQCSHSTCGEIDFLPILCVRCKDFFCRFHASVGAHTCSADIAQQTPSAAASPLLRCSTSGCGKPSLEAFVASDEQGRTPAKCLQCHGSFCAEHRHPKSHGCESPVQTAKKNEAGRALLSKHFPSSQSKATASRTSLKLPADPAKALLILRHRAVPLDPKDKSSALVPSERFIFRAEDKVFWTRKNVGAGRVVDLLATQLGTSSTKPLFLRKESGLRCQSDLALASQIIEGSTVHLSEEEDA
ncbi:hypothetical protein C8F01DRAFT_54614 [Mycena amicta]|nr:hypothetical protein C8F01DRAFT_54614 [Mycena amicta]